MIYISGPMTGIKDFNYPEFNRVTKELREQGHEVLNPVEICNHLDNTTATWEDYMMVCLPAIDKCDTIYLLDGWEQSTGARLELKIAKEYGLEIIYQGAKNE